ncbi:sulfate reduction electron transfer complex DsrMKJOP subunit DsrJ [Desulfosporosinus sp. BICA1-9]|uniref:sulfate reduction electron transfer complex DsrMKJOP subunit DsrJ n=1 Tax=Desulfosporosinus sp. BICA1-9 TaxID=1531958 RepID=UPI00054B06D1|nr:sulfate reduction electron transfer complex DsrMKJOP subunit DsrJ [Desulfosporosinus sp. BICA1-9]KJS46267.1 MAG: menaquinol oxidoreductase [Peptococcaceae bacterium BRH_c23]KJS80748.1 MAG: menaquinol oxidoreductase [Desulfosporosinus sp. BICA1-9]HBW35866.1 menaquinol oxidoreductase [Desulfosporosinus sp.]
MYKGGKIIASLIIFIGLLTLPFFYNMGKANAGPDVPLDTPAIQQLADKDKECVESPEYMRANHMQLLNDWRTAAVRDGQTVYVNSKGTEYEISLQDTCLKCHATDTAASPVVLNNPVSSNTGMSNPTLNSSNSSPQFCASCHDYSAVKPLCWSCHFEPKEAVK